MDKKQDVVALIPAIEPRCKICGDARRADIEAAMLQPGMSMRAVARHFGLILGNLQNHRPHMGGALAASQAIREVESISELYKRIKAKAERLQVLSDTAAAAGNVRDAIAAMAEARKHTEMLAKFAQMPGFREQPGNTQINAPDARIVVTTTMTDD